MTKLKNSFTLFFYAFRLNDGVDFRKLASSDDSFWAPSESEPEKNYFFNHVQDFFSKNKGAGNSELDDSCCILYELKKHNLKESQKERIFLFNQLFTRQI